MNDLEYVKKFGQIYNKIVKNLKDDDFQINEVQMRKFFEVYEFFKNAALEAGSAEVEPIKLVPREEHGGVTATFIVFDMYGKYLEEFKKIVQHLSALCIDVVGEDRVCISVTVPNVFVEKR